MSKLECPHCNGAHTLSQCPTWYAPSGYRLMPVKLLPAIRDAIVETGKCFDPDGLWAAIVAAHDFANSTQVCQVCAHGYIADRCDACGVDSETAKELMSAGQDRSTGEKAGGLSAPKGWLLVPESPTTAMLDAACKADVLHNVRPNGKNVAEWIYSAMLRSASEPDRQPASGADDLHPDDAAVDRFAVAMKERMAEMRGRGRNGWDDPNKCPLSRLIGLMRAVPCSQPVDIGNYAMMLFNRAITENTQRTTANGAGSLP